MSQKKSVIYECPFCPKIFKSKGGKYKHIKKCPKNPIINKKLELLKKQLEEERKLTKKLEQKIENHENEKTKLELKNQIEINTILKTQAAAIKNVKVENSVTNNNCVINNISIKLFLDKHCKNALSIMDFVKELQFKLSDINPDRPASTIESLSKAITDKLEDMDETERPLHCSDAKRLVFHVKDASGWTKDVDNKKIDNAITWANARQQGAWIKKATDDNWTSKKNDSNYLNMNVAMSKFSDNPDKAKNRVKRAIAKIVSIKEVLNK